MSDETNLDDMVISADMLCDMIETTFGSQPYAQLNPILEQARELAKDMRVAEHFFRQQEAEIAKLREEAKAFWNDPVNAKSAAWTKPQTSVGSQVRPVQDGLMAMNAPPPAPEESREAEALAEFMKRPGAVKVASGEFIEVGLEPRHWLYSNGHVQTCANPIVAWSKDEYHGNIIAYAPVISEPEKGETREVIQGEVGREFPGAEGYQHVVDAEPAPVLRADVPAERPHSSDCATNNEPAHPAGECDCTLRLEWTPYSKIEPKSPDNLAGYRIETRFSDLHNEWVYRHVLIAAAVERDDAFSINEVDREEPVSLDQMDDLGITDPNASAMLRMLMKEDA